LGQRLTEIRQLGADVVAIAVTAIYAQQAFAASLGADFALLSDWGGDVARSFGVEYDSWKGHAGLAKRSVFIIDQSGVVRYRWVTDDASVQPDLDEVISRLGEIRRALPHPRS
jgi:peroxiredoxin